MDFEKRLQGLMPLQDPGARFTEEVLDLVKARANGRSKTRSRFIVIGTLLVVAAAAAMLGLQLWHPTEQPAVAQVSAPPSPPVEHVPEPEVSVVAPAPASSAAEEIVAPQLPAPPQFTVRMLPLQNAATDEPTRAAVNAFHAAFLNELRAVPGLTLIEGESTGNTPAAPDEYRITVKGLGPVAGNRFGTGIEIERMPPGGMVPTRSTFGGPGEIAPACAGLARTGPISCMDPLGLAALRVQFMRTRVFPTDPALQQRLRARLINQSLNPRERVAALGDLRVLGSSLQYPDTSALRDPAVIRGAIDVVARATDPMQRAQIWRELRGVRNTGLVQPLITAVRQDGNDEVRLQALATLVEDYASDPRARTVFETTARVDSRPLVRALAQRALTGEEAWQQYIVSSLKDTNRSDVERIEALFYQLNLRTANLSGSFAPAPVDTLRKLLDDEVTRAITEVLPGAASDSPVIRNSAFTFVSELVAIGHPAFTEMLLRGLEQKAGWMEGTWVVQQLAQRSSEPRIRSTLEKLAASDPDPLLREAAATALKSR
jgi:hypothetical protein